MPLLAKGGTKTARLWTYVRDDRPFAGGAPPAALFHFSRDREMAHPNRHLAGWQGLLQADAYGGYNDLYRGDRDPGPVISALCWSHARRKLFELADLKEKARKRKPVSPVALEAVTRIDAIFDVERGINGLDAAPRLEARQRLVRPLVDELHDWMRAERGTMSRHNPVAKAIAYMFKTDRWEAFARFLDDGRICLTNNAAERALRGVATRRSLCPPSSSVWKHGELVLRIRPTRASFPSQCDADGVVFEVDRPDSDTARRARPARQAERAL